MCDHRGSHHIKASMHFFVPNVVSSSRRDDEEIVGVLENSILHATIFSAQYQRNADKNFEDHNFTPHPPSPPQ